MKRWVRAFGVLSLAFIAVMLMGSVALAGAYSVVNISNNTTNDMDPKINASGEVVWHGDGGIFLYQDGVVSQLTTDSADEVYINASGQVVWEGYDGTDYEIFLYQDGVVSQLTNNSTYDYWPQINDRGQVVWVGYDGTDYEIFLYQDGVVTNISNNSTTDNGWPQINDRGQVVWHGYDGDWQRMDGDYEIFLYQDGVVTQLTTNSTDDVDPQINASGQVVWEGYDGRWGYGYDGMFQYHPGHDGIFLYQDGVVSQIPNNSTFDVDPQINDSGQVVWDGSEGDQEIFLYQDGVVTQLTTNSTDEWDPQINASGQVVWVGYATRRPKQMAPENFATGNEDDGWEIFLYQDGVVSQLTTNSAPDWFPQINNSGQVVWWGYDGTDYEIFLAAPIPNIEVQ